MKAITIIILVAFLATSIAVVPATAINATLYASGRKDRPKPPPPDNDGGTRDDRSKPPPPDDDTDRRPPREKPDRPGNNHDARPPRERGEPPTHDYDNDSGDRGSELDFGSRICHCGRIGCTEHYYEYYDPDEFPNGYTDTKTTVGVYGLGTATVMFLNLVHVADTERRNEGLAVAGLALGVTGVVWSFIEHDPWHQRTLMLTGLFSAGLAIMHLASDEPPDSPYTAAKAPVASVSFSF
jgi:hypothetical protein